MSSNQLIHIKMDYLEALESKRDILIFEKKSIGIMKTIRRYKMLRKKELDEKMKLSKKILEVTSDMKNLLKSFPAVEVKKFIKQIEENPEMKELENTLDDAQEAEQDYDLEQQLKEIQGRLNEIRI